MLTTSAESYPQLEETGKQTSSASAGGLVRRAAKGTAWTVASYVAAQLLRFVSNILLSRLLVPQYFGVMTLLNTVITGMNLFSDLGLAPGIIRSKRGDDPVFLNTAWTIQAFRGIGLWLICCCLAWPIAAFYGESQLKTLVPVLSLCLVISGFASTNLATAERHLEVRKLAGMEFTVQFTQLIFTLVWAWLQPSIWALVAGRIFSEVAHLYLGYRLLPGHRNRFAWNREAVRELVGFGRWVFLSTALTFLSTQSDRLILGKLVSFRTLGLYGIAFAFADLPRQLIISFCSRIAFPFVSKFAQMDRDDFLMVALRYRRIVLFCAAALLAVIVNTADLGLVWIYDRRYHDASWMIPILALGLWHTLLYSTISPFLWAIGRPRYHAVGYTLSAALMFTAVPLAFHLWGLAGAVWAIAFSDLPVYFANLYGAWRQNFFTLFQDFQATFLFAALCGLLFLARTLAGIDLPHPIALH